MSEETAIILFKEKTIRRTWYNGEWWFAVADIVSVLTDSVNLTDYIKKCEVGTKN